MFSLVFVLHCIATVIAVKWHIVPDGGNFFGERKSRRNDLISGGRVLDEQWFQRYYFVGTTNCTQFIWPDEIGLMWCSWADETEYYLQSFGFSLRNVTFLTFFAMFIYTYFSKWSTQPIPTRSVFARGVTSRLQVCTVHGIGRHPAFGRTEASCLASFSRLTVLTARRVEMTDFFANNKRLNPKSMWWATVTTTYTFTCNRHGVMDR